MQKKLVVLFLFVLSAFIGLSARLILINRDSGEQYKRQVLSQQRYDSRVIPFKRGDIVDCKGTKLAVSEKVYNVILDAKLAGEKKEYIEATTKALHDCFKLDASEIRAYIAANPSSQYYVLAKKLSYDEISPFVELQNDTANNPNIKGVWFEEEYERTYPNGSLACDLIGFTGKDNVGSYGLEEYYNDTLNGINGREYGYLNDDSTLERTTKSAVDGNTIVTTIDSNIQSIVEKYLKKFNTDNQNVERDGNGAYNIGCIMMNVNTGEILAMANYPNYDLNDTKNPKALLGMNKLDAEGKETDEVITQEVLDAMDDDTLYANLNALWKNFCITSTYEPGSVAKPFTVAAGLECGKLTGDETYFCGGSLWYGGHEIHCHNRLGDGMLTVKQAVEVSCNVALMQMGDAIGKDDFLKFQELYNFGLKTNIDLAGEARTSGLVYNSSSMGEAELATSTFGQGYNVTMIQMISGFCSLINGGYYYEPHVVNKIVSSDGTTIKNIKPRLLKQTVSASTSEKIVDYCNGVVTEGTGHTARPAGYAVGGKTGTAEMVPRNKKNYVVSFMGYAPADDPQIAIYVVVDRPNTARQDDAKFATGIVRNILTEVLPYENYFMTEELSEDELTEMSESELPVKIPGEETEETEEGTEGEGAGEGAEDPESVEVTGGEGTTDEESGQTEEITEEEKEWQERIANYETDPETGYLIEPETGVLIDPATGQAVDGSSFMN
ncbi:MAG: cell division protein FtsI [Lachnospiraceae bacterium]|nr:cell division protein FtsI [Lachnospiraceae bacterium]